VLDYAGHLHLLETAYYTSPSMCDVTPRVLTGVQHCADVQFKACACCQRSILQPFSARLHVVPATHRWARTILRGSSSSTLPVHGKSLSDVF